MMSTETTTKTNHYFRALAVLAALALAASLLVQAARPAEAAPENVRAWGLNDAGQLGNGTNGFNAGSNTPVSVSNLSDAKTVAGGCLHSLALKNDGTVRAWGENSNGQLGIGTYADSNVPAQVSNLSGVKAIAAGCEHSLALKNDGTVWAWGYNAFGQLGDGTYANSNVPVQVSNLSDVKTIAAGSYHNLALKNNGTVLSWGRNLSGQLGIGTKGMGTDKNTPVRVRGDISDIKAIAGGGDHSLALKNDGTVRSWGDNDWGQLGDGTNVDDSNVLVQVSNSSGVQAIAAGGDHSLAAKQ